MTGTKIGKAIFLHNFTSLLKLSSSKQHMAWSATWRWFPAMHLISVYKSVKQMQKKNT
jgi:hypothetical protein